MSWRRILQSYQLYLIPSVVLTVVTGLTVLVLIPSIRQSWELRGQLKSEQNKLWLMGEKAAALRSLDDGELNQRVKLLEAALPTEKDINLVIRRVKQVAADTSVSLVSLEAKLGEVGTERPKGTVAQVKSEVRELPLEMTVTGTTDKIFDFLTGIEQAYPVMDIDSLSFSQDKTGLQVKLSVKAWFWQSPTSLGPAEKPLVQLTPQEESEYQKLAAEVRVETATGAAEVPLGNPKLLE